MATAKKAAPAKKAAAKTPAKPAGKAKPAPKGKPGREEEAEERKPATGKAMVSYDEMLAKLREKGEKEAQREAHTGEGGTPYMNTEGKEFSIGGDDGEDYGDSINCVVIATSFFNAWYDSPYVRGQASVPACYAVAEEEEDLAPADNAPRPQADTCAECPMNEWDSGPNGTGKACSNRRKLCILMLSDLEEGVVRPIVLSLPPTALKFWGRYVKAIKRQHNTSFAGVVTRFDFDEDNPQPCPIPTFEGMVPEELLALAFNAMADGEEIVLATMNTEGYVPPEEKKKASSKLGGKNKPAAKKAAPAKKSAKGGSGKPVRGRR